jgi:hypothetical protein
MRQRLSIVLEDTLGPDAEPSLLERWRRLRGELKKRGFAVLHDTLWSDQQPREPGAPPAPAANPATAEESGKGVAR